MTTRTDKHQVSAIRPARKTKAGRKTVKDGAECGLSEKPTEQHVPVQVEGRVVTVKDYESPHGDVVKMVVRSETDTGGGGV